MGISHGSLINYSYHESTYAGIRGQIEAVHSTCDEYHWLIRSEYNNHNSGLHSGNPRHPILPARTVRRLTNLLTLQNVLKQSTFQQFNLDNVDHGLIYILQSLY